MIELRVTEKNYNKDYNNAKIVADLFTDVTITIKSVGHNYPLQIVFFGESLPTIEAMTKFRQLQDNKGEVI